MVDGLHCFTNNTDRVNEKLISNSCNTESIKKENRKMRSLPQGKTDQSEAGSNKLKFPSDLIGQCDVHQLPRRAHKPLTNKNSRLFLRFKFTEAVCTHPSLVFIFQDTSVFVYFGSVNCYNLYTGCSTI